jgi:hypothetical protein
MTKYELVGVKKEDTSHLCFQGLEVSWVHTDYNEPPTTLQLFIFRLLGCRYWTTTKHKKLYVRKDDN